MEVGLATSLVLNQLTRVATCSQSHSQDFTVQSVTDHSCGNVVLIRIDGAKETGGTLKAKAMGVEIVAKISSDSHALRTSGRATPRGVSPNLQVDFILPLAYGTRPVEPGLTPKRLIIPKDTCTLAYRIDHGGGQSRFAGKTAQSDPFLVAVQQIPLRSERVDVAES